MFCSTVIPTIGRASLARAVNSVLDQSFTADEFEVIVVNDSGSPLPEASWRHSSRVQVIHTNKRERCVARNAGAAIARGKYLHFLDDDDWLLPGALAAFWDLAQATDAAWLYGGSQLVDREGQPIIELHHHLSGNCLVQVMAGEWIPLQSSLINARSFSAVGGFDPRTPGSEDIHLARCIALCGDMAETSITVAAIGMGTEASSTNYARAATLRRRAREEIFDAPGAFKRMCASANTGSWKGRLVRAYLTSAAWNLASRRVFVALSRAAHSLAGLALAGPHLLSVGFWRNLARNYESETFLRGFSEANRPPVKRQEPHSMGV
jgi:glycosyltransferase involved in cell wall biosynthesis